MARVAELALRNTEMMMRTLILAGTVLVLVAGVATGAVASDRKTGKGGSQVGRFHTAASGGTHHIRHNSRLAGVRAPEGWYPGSAGYQGGFVDLGPLGMTAACGFYPVGHGYCGPDYGTPIDARR